MPNLDEKDKDILQCWLDAWGGRIHGRETKMTLYGHISYSDVDGLVRRMGLSSPVGLTEIMDGTFEKRAATLIASSDPWWQ